MPDSVRYRWTRAYGLRLVGGATIALAVLWVIAALAGFAWWSVVLVLAAAAVAVGCLLRFVVTPPVLLQVNTSGYQVHSVRGSGVSEASWSDVESVSTAGTDGGPVMTVHLADGRTTAVPLALLGRQAVAAEREMHSRLNAAFGYRRLHNGSPTRESGA